MSQLSHAINDYQQPTASHHADHLPGPQHDAQTYSHAVKLGDSSRIVEFGRRLAFAVYSKGYIDSALSIYETILPMARKRKVDGLGKIFNMMALCFSWQAKYDKALALHFESLGIRQSRNDTIGIATCLNNIGLVFYKLKDYDKALRYFHRTLDLQESVGDNWLEPLLTNIGLCYAYNEQLDSARHFLHRAISICAPECEPFITVQVEFGYAIAFLNEHDHANAKFHFMQSYILARSLNDDRLQLDNLYYLMAISLEEDKLDKAAHWMQRAKAVSANSSTFNLEFAKIYKRMAEVYEKMGDLKNVAFYLKKYIALRDSIYNQDLTINRMRIEGHYLERENLARIETQNTLLATEANLIHKQRWVALSSTLLVVVATVVVIAFYRTLRQRKQFAVILAERLAGRINAVRHHQVKMTHATLNTNLRIRKICSELTSRVALLKSLCRETPANGAPTLDPECILRIATTAARMDRVVKDLERIATDRRSYRNTPRVPVPTPSNAASPSSAHKL